MLFELSSVHK